MKHTKNVDRRRAMARGFSLIELLLVMVILSILAVLVVPRFAGQSEKAKLQAARSDIAAIELAIRMFETQVARYPTQQEGLAALVDKPANAEGWTGPYLEKGLPTDPWGKAYQYRYPSQHKNYGYDLWSYGPDGQDGGGDDIDNWTK